MLELKEYQKEASEIVENKFNSGINKTSVIWPTGLGKTIVPIDLIKKHPDKKFLIIAPRHSIISQTKEYMEENEISKEKVVFYTYSGLSKMSEELMSKLEPDYIVLDEMHRVGAREWGKGVDRLLEKYNKANTLGLTATPIRMDGKNMVEEKFDADISHEITLEEAIARGLLKMPKSYINAIYSLDGEIGDIEESISRVKDEEERQRLEAKLEAVKRKLQESKGLPEIFAERMSQRNGKYIIFCKDIAHMHEMMEKANEMFKAVNKNIEIYNISSEKNNLQNEKEIEHFKENNNDSLKLLYSVDMFNEGLHIENTGIIMFRPTTSWIIYLQQLGRTLGIEESGEVFDIVNNSRSSKDIYQFYESVKEIQKREKIEGVSIDFTIYDEVREIQELLKEINEAMHIDKYTFEEKLEYLKKLKEEGIDLSQVKQKDKSDDGKSIGRWITGFRQDYGMKKLNKKDIEKLEELGIDLKPQQGEKYDKEEKIEILRKLKQEGMDLSQIKKEDKSDDRKPIGIWICQFRKAYNREKLSKKDIEELEELGIDLKPQQGEKYDNEEKIEIFRKLKEEGRDLSQVKQRDKSNDGKPIGMWIGQFRKDYNRGKLSKKDIEELEELGIDLKPQQGEKYDNEERIEILRKLKEEGMDLLQIKRKDKSDDGKHIGRWIDQFRRDYNKGELSPKDIEELEELGIDLKRQKGEEYDKEEKIETLRKLKEEGMDLSQVKQRDKSNDGKPIGVWINQFRQAYNREKLSEKEIEELEELEIDLKPQYEKKHDKEEKIEILRKLKEEGIDLSQVKHKDKSDDGRSIGVWIWQFRMAYNKGELSPKDIETLEELGIDLKPQQGERHDKEERIETLRKLKEEGIDLSQINSREESNDGKPIGRWIWQFKNAYKKKKLNERDIEELKSLGIYLSLEDKQEQKEKAEEKLEQAKELYEQYEQLLGHKKRKDEEK